MNVRSGFRKRTTGAMKPMQTRDARQTPRMASRDRVTRCLALAIVGFGLMANYVKAADLDKPTDMPQDNRWLKEHLLNDKAQLPFSFAYDRQGSNALLKVWPRKTETKQIDSNRTEHTVLWSDPKTGLQVRLEAMEFANSPVVEWTAYFRNDGKGD